MTKENGPHPLYRAIGYQTPNEKENAFRQQNNQLEKAA